MSPSFSVKLVSRHERTGSLEPARQGRPTGTGKLAPYAGFLTGRVREKPDITMPERAAELAARHGVEANPALLSRFLCTAGISYKTLLACERERSDVAKLRATWIGKRQPIMAPCGIASSSSMRPRRTRKLTRLRGRAPIVERLPAVPFGHWHTKPSLQPCAATV